MKDRLLETALFEDGTNMKLRSKTNPAIVLTWPFTPTGPKTQIGRIWEPIPSTWQPAPITQ